MHVGVGLPPSEGRLDTISSELRDIKKTPTLEAELLASCSLKSISRQLKEIKQCSQQHLKVQKEQSKHYMELQEEQSKHYMDLQEEQSLKLQDMKTSLLSLETAVKKLSENAHSGLLKGDEVDVDSLVSSFATNPPPSSSSFASLPPAFGSPLPAFGSPSPAFGSLPPAFGSPPPSYSFGMTSPGYHPMIPSLSGKQMRATSAPPTCMYFQQDCHGGNEGDASCSLKDVDYPLGQFELECGEPLPPSTSDKTLARRLVDEEIRSKDEDICQPVESGMPSQIPARLTNKETPISPRKYKSSDEVLSLYRYYKNTKDIGKLAIALAKYTYFGVSVMTECTVTGRGETTALDPVKLGLLQNNIRAIFPQMDDDEFIKTIWEKCKESLAGCCKGLRAATCSKHP